MGTGWSRPKHGHRPACSPNLRREGRALTALSAPPGLAVDYHNERLYWADAKLSVIGSIRLNGTDPIVAADSKRGQPCSPDLRPLSSPLGSRPHPVPAILPTRHTLHQPCRPESTLTLWATFTVIHSTNGC